MHRKVFSCIEGSRGKNDVLRSLIQWKGHFLAWRVSWCHQRIIKHDLIWRYKMRHPSISIPKMARCKMVRGPKPMPARKAVRLWLKCGKAGQSECDMSKASRAGYYMLACESSSLQGKGFQTMQASDLALLCDPAVHSPFDPPCWGCTDSIFCPPWIFAFVSFLLKRYPAAQSSA